MNVSPGLYDQILTDALRRAVEAEGLLLSKVALDPTEAHEQLARALSGLLRRALYAVPEEKRPALQVRVANEMIAWLSERLQEPSLLRETLDSEGAVLEEIRRPGEPQRTRPLLPLSSSALLVNGHGEPRIGEELRREIASADRIDLVCAFIKWVGIRVLEGALEAFLEAGKPLRIITTTYLGATELRPLDWLMKRGAKVKVSYDTQVTRLHAKAWLFHRATGFSTAYVGSSNLSRSALLDGVEWNVRLSAQSAPAVVEKFSATFETYWNDPSFEDYHRERLVEALRAERGDNESINLAFLDVHPYPHQRAILEALEVERMRHSRWKNLVVAATGTGKTVVAALDYKRLRGSLLRARLLFVAHRKEILEQSLRTFRTVLRDGAFGSLCVDGERPEAWEHVFASIQSLSRMGPEKFGPADFDVVIVDEFHHAEAATYRALLSRLTPQVLLGLTATPERADGQDVLGWFDGRIAAELRLWDALERGLLCPFHYFGVHDDVDLSRLRWSRGAYDRAELEALYTGDDARIGKILEQVQRLVPDPRSMRALGFCVGVKHAHYMAQRFVEANIPAMALHAESSAEERSNALRRLRNREINVLFTVDLLNEGVDIPEVDTVLFLRPTESATVFLQQLGRGLRRTEDKACVTVLDFIGAQHARFRFDARYAALLGCPRLAVEKQVREGFPVLPAGCHIELDRVATRVVLDNLRQSVKGQQALVRLLASLGNVSLGAFLREAQIGPEDLYRSERTFSFLRRKAGLPTPPSGPEESILSRSLGRLLYVDDAERTKFYREVLAEPKPPRGGAVSLRQARLLRMLGLGLWGTKRSWPSIDAALARLWEHPAILEELRELLGILDEGAKTLARPLPELGNIPISVHGRYQRTDVLGAFDMMSIENPFSHQSGVAWSEAHQTDILFVTLRKHAADFSPSTMYRDYAIGQKLFHWESQSRTAEASTMGQRYIHHESRGTRVMLFARETKDDPFVSLGPARYVQHSGERPMGIVWELAHEMPEELLRTAMLVAA
ncbi:DEAD/DEAH box helicase [Polyangium sp. 15x6]|uniref:DUF3427 domain-containing protein n=1 Tax=Polyangium sp. 15x6 TaxID=3042687 RepID=UPI00249BDB41|nr:DEAD/DEAH box helicase [Polyangium sp. 15x6]MDI3282592.1 DUF3427 domain-containing protein [Polyangium sp. 15x6]